MRIALRTSGGRGEYELAGRQANIHNSDLFGLNLSYQLAPDLTIDGRSAAQLRDGKPRIRLNNAASDHHAYRLFAAVLLLPPARRELRLTSDSDDFIRAKQYAISDIDVDVAGTSGSTAYLRPTKLWLRNSTGLVRGVEVADRMALIHAIWDAAHGEAGTLADLVRAHEHAAYSGDHNAIERAAAALRDYFATDGDILDALAHRFKASVGETEIAEEAEAPDEDAEDETHPDDARRREIAKWRRQAARTAAGRKFALEVRTLYADRCAVSGARLPKLEATASAGVDAAHILPWAKYDLNSVTNGICLNKLCHWGFDAGVIRLDYAESNEQYIVSIPNEVSEQAQQVGVQLEYFKQFLGPIPEDRLPEDPALRPSPQYLTRLNEEMYG